MKPFRKIFTKNVLIGPRCFSGTISLRCLIEFIINAESYGMGFQNAFLMSRRWKSVSSWIINAGRDIIMFVVVFSTGDYLRSSSLSRIHRNRDQIIRRMRFWPTQLCAITMASFWGPLVVKKYGKISRITTLSRALNVFDLIKSKKRTPFSIKFSFKENIILKCCDNLI